MELALRYFIHIYVATNGVFSEEVEKILLDAGSRVSIFLNISTPSFVFDEKTRRLVLQRIKNLSSSTRRVVLVVVSKFLHKKEATEIINLIDNRLLKQVTVRLTVEGTVAGRKNYTTIAEFPKIGKKFFDVYRYLEGQSPKSIEILKSSVFPCMFTPEQRQYLKQRGHLKIFHCHPKLGEGSFFITPSLKTFNCYSLSTRDRLIITKETSFKELRNYYQTLQDKYHKEFTLPQCRKCPFFGLEEGKCPGPCLGFKINALNQY